MHEDPVAWLNQDIIQWIAFQRVAQVYAEASRRAVRLPAEKLRGVQPYIWGYTSSLKNHIAQMLLSRRAITAWRANFAGDEHFGIRLKVESPEDAHRIKRFKLWRFIGMFESSCQIKSLDNWVVVRCMQPNDLRVTRRRLGKQVSIGSHEVCKFHLWLVGVPARPQHMSLEINRRGVVWRDRENVYLVAVLNFKSAHLRAHRFRITGVADLHAQHRALFVRYQALHFNVLQCCCGKNSSRKIEHI